MSGISVGVVGHALSLGGSSSVPARGLMLAVALLLSALFSGGLLAAEGVVNINQASAEELTEMLNGIGMAKAQRIVEYREMHGPFEHVDELAEVRGIGQSTIEKNRDRIALE